MRDPQDSRDSQDFAAEFAAIVLGLDGVDYGPPDPSSPLGRVIQLRRELAAAGVPAEERSRQVRALWSRCWDAMPELPPKNPR